MTPGCKRNAMLKGAPVTRSAGCGPVMIRHAARIMAGLRGNQCGSIAVEFALVAPVLMVVLAGVIDIGSAAYVRHSLDTRVTAAAEYALMEPELKDQVDADDLAERLVALVRPDASETVEVVVNSACHCPTRSNGQIDLGMSLSCGTSCGASGETAGQFVQISATARHVSIFPGYAFSDGDTVGASAVLRLN